MKKEPTPALQADQAISILSAFPWSDKDAWTWFGLFGLYRPGGAVVAKVELVSSSTHGQLDALSVKAFAPKGAMADWAEFLIADYVTDSGAPGARVDDHSDRTPRKFFVRRTDGSTAWYIAVPSAAALRRLVDAVETYADSFWTLR